MLSKTNLLPLLRTNLLNRKSFSTSLVKQHGLGPEYGHYRLNAPPIDYGPRIKLRTFSQSFIWAWVFYHFWYNSEVMLGHPMYEMPDPKKWSDEELGIPPDDYDEDFQLKM